MQENKLQDTLVISIILPVFNGEKYLETSIESCLNQTYHNIELIIVNDCSTDKTLQIIEDFARRDHRVKIINNTRNEKLPKSLNIGHKAATGDLITWTSDDNIYNLDALEILSRELTSRTLDIVYSDILLMDEEGKNLREIKYPDIENIIFGNYIGSSFLYKKQVYEKNKGYNENLFLVEDYDFWLRAISHSKFGKVFLPLYRYRKHSGTLTSQIATNESKNELWKSNISIMYESFCTNILGKVDSELASLFCKKLTYQALKFEWLKQNKKRIDSFKLKLLENPNFNDKNNLERIFMKKHIEIMLEDGTLTKDINASFFIIKNYFQVLDINSLKTLLKFSLRKRV